MFLNGVAQNPWLPLVLAALAIAGVAAGILLSMRSFLFLGLSFLAIALFTIIWYAAVDRDQTLDLVGQRHHCRHPDPGPVRRLRKETPGNPRSLRTPQAVGGVARSIESANECMHCVALLIAHPARGFR